MSAATPRVLQATAWYPPHSVGGTEIYVAGLVEELRGLGVESAVLTPRPDIAGAETYVHAGTSVRTYPVDPRPAPGELQRSGAHVRFEAFRACLAAYAGGIYHQHSWTRGCGLHHLRTARSMGLKTVLTVHVPNIICMRGTMLAHGRLPCDGRIEERRCGACWAHGRGLPPPAAHLLARLPLTWSRRARSGWRTRLTTALSARALGAERLDQLAEMIANADRVVAVCQWLYDALAANGVPRTKLVLIRQGLPAAFLGAAAGAALAPPSADAALRLIYVGRWDWLKGIDIAVSAVRALPRTTAVTLTVHASPGAAEDAAYQCAVRRMAAGDPRIVFAEPLARSELVPALTRHDALVVPSRCLETGPLVIMEAQAVGLHVLGANLGGIAELVGGGKGGELVAAQDVSAWSAAIAQLAERHSPSSMPRSPGRVRSMAAVAAEMAHLYRSL